MYKITIEELQPNKEPGTYGQWRDIYMQQVPTIDVAAIAQLINTPPTKAALAGEVGI